MDIKPQPKSIVVVGRRWFEKTNGNTYHTVQIYIDGELVVKLPFQYGYGEQYVSSAAQWLEENGYMPCRQRYPSGTRQPASEYFHKRKVTFSIEVVDVARRKDL